MMFDRIMSWFDRSKKKEEVVDDDGCKPKKDRATRDLERREQEARRQNDMVQGIVDTIQHRDQA